MTTILTVDVVGLLDQSKVGADAARSLEKAWNEAKGQPEEKRNELLAQLQAKRDGLRQRLFERAKPIMAEVARQKGAIAVLDKSVVAWSPGEDITALIIAKVDAGGPLST